jgi:hypothetical protein
MFFIQLLGFIELMGLGMALIVLAVMFIIYKMDATYPELSFWANTRLEVSELIAGRSRK